MKRIVHVILLCAGAMFLSNCSADERESGWVSPENPTLVKKMTTTTYDDQGQVTGVSVENFEYDGVNLISIKKGTRETKFLYSGTKITRREEYNSGVLTKAYKYVYESGKLVAVRHDKTGSDIETFYYQYEGDIPAGFYHTYDNHEGTFQNMNVYSYQLQYSNNNLRKSTYTSDSMGSIDVDKPSYDSNPNPFRDTNPYFRISFHDDLSQNNFVTSQTIQGKVTQRTFDYNSAGFPTIINAQTASWYEASSSVTEIEYL